MNKIRGWLIKQLCKNHIVIANIKAELSFEELQEGIFFSEKDPVFIYNCELTRIKSDKKSVKITLKDRPCQKKT